MKTATTINERLAKVREALGHSPQGFADIIGVSRSFLANMEASRKNVGLDTVTFLSETLGVSSDYILLGRGQMFRSGTNPDVSPKETANLSANVSANLSPNNKSKRTNFQETDTRDNLRILVATVDSKERENIALVNTRVAAGYADGGFMEPEFMKRLPSFSLPDSAYKNATFRAFQVSGDSMQPTLWEGDWVICRYIDQWDRDIRDTFVHVVVTNDRPVVKRLLNRLNERGQITLQSDNPAYPAQFIDGESIREVWVAVGRLSRQFANPRFDLVEEVSRTRADVDELMARLNQFESMLSIAPNKQLKSPI